MIQVSRLSDIRRELEVRRQLWRAPAQVPTSAPDPVQPQSDSRHLVSHYAQMYDMSPDDFIAYQELLGGPSRPRPVLKSSYAPPQIDVSVSIKKGTEELNNIVDVVINHASRRAETLKIHATMIQDPKYKDAFTDAERMNVAHLMEVDIKEIEVCKAWALNVSEQLNRLIETRRALMDQKAFANRADVRDSFTITTTQLNMIRERLIGFVDLVGQ